MVNMYAKPVHTRGVFRRNTSKRKQRRALHLYTIQIFGMRKKPRGFYCTFYSRSNLLYLLPPRKSTQCGSSSVTNSFLSTGSRISLRIYHLQLSSKHPHLCLHCILKSILFSQKISLKIEDNFKIQNRYINIMIIPESSLLRLQKRIPRSNFI